MIYREIYMIYVMLKKIKGEKINFISLIWIIGICNGFEVEKGYIRGIWFIILGFEDY